MKGKERKKTALLWEVSGQETPSISAPSRGC
jgi:hypothetical protein